MRQSQLHDCMVTATHGWRTRAVATVEPLGVDSWLAPDDHGLVQTRGARILLAEDHPINRRIAVAQLKELGLEADVVKNGQEAIDAYERHRYELILMDCQMPVVDGFAATRAIRAIQARDGGHVRIVAMTANAMEGDRNACLEAGMDDYVSKPVELDKLRESLLPLLARPGRSDDLQLRIPSETDAMTEALDYVRLQEVFGGDDLAIGEVLEQTISECLPLAAAMRTAVARKEVAAATQAAHKFNGVCGNVGANELAAIGRTIERAVKSANWPSAEVGCGDLEGALNRFIAAVTIVQRDSEPTPLREAL
jgi:CheY-like chemotaxis protein